jgi:SAM-dependent methyltransferase
MTALDSRQLPQPDEINRSTWARTGVVAAYEAGRTGWWSDPGEEAAFAAMAPELRNATVLDVGVGAGRTTGILRLLTDDYVGVDYTPEMVERCRRRYPGTNILLGDVRSLSQMDLGRFGVAIFSYNGLDCIDHDDRQRGLDELQRVLRPGGLLLFSTHNLNGPAYRPTPWRQAGGVTTQRLAYRLGRFAANVILNPLHLPRSVRNWYILRRCGIEGDGWATSVVESEDFGLILHFTTLAHQVAELDRHGFDVDAVFTAETGECLSPLASSDTRYFHIVARKRP